MKNKTSSIILIFIIFSTILISIYKIKFSPHLSIILCISIIIIYQYIFDRTSDFSWVNIEKYMIEGISQALMPIFLLAMVGIMISVWMMSGTIPSVLYFGVKIISRKWFYLSSLFICMISSFFNGSGITVASTIGVAMMGIAKALDLPLDISAGAIICGSCFGDKCSPLSETTNLAPGILNINLFTHVKNLFWTTIPAISISIAVFWYLGFTLENTKITSDYNLDNQIAKYFVISKFNFVPIILVLAMVLFRFHPFSIFFIGIISGLLISGSIQKNFNLTYWGKVMQNGFVLDTKENSLISSLFNRGGLIPMMWSISLILIALSMGGILKGLNIIDNLISLISKKLNSKKMLTLASAMVCILVNFMTGEQFLSILIPGKVFKDYYIKEKIPLKFLSSTLEDCGTLVNPLVPWGVAGAFYSSALGVEVIDYIPYTFFLYLSPIFNIIFGFWDFNKYKQKKI